MDFQQRMEQEKNKTTNPSGKIDTKKAAVETYAGDIAEILKSDKEGLVRKIIEDAEKEQTEEKSLSPEFKNNKIFILSSFGLLFLGSLVLSFVLFTRESGIVPAEEQFSQIIFTDQTSFIEISGLNPQEVKQALLHNAENSELKNNDVLGIYPVLNKNIMGLRAFFDIIKSSFAPGKEEFLSDDFLLGAVKTQRAEDNIDMFILIEGRSTPDMFAPLKAWEEKMLLELHDLFGIAITGDTNYLIAKEFENGIIENKNARVLYDKDNKIVLMYVFADENSVIIGDSINAVREIHLRVISKAKE